jgi:hypothetical protein
MQANIYESYRPLLESWKAYTDVVKEHVEGYSDVEATQLSILLENTKSEIEVCKGRMMNGTPVVEGTDISMVNTFTSNVFDIITAVMPNLLANDIVSVQPLDRRNGQVFFLKFTYGNNKGGIKAGDNMLTSQQGFAGNDFSGEHVSGEVLTIAEGKVDQVLAHTPIKPGTVKLTSPDDLAVELKDVPNADGVTGTFTDTASTGLGAGTVNYTTGAVQLTGVTKQNVEIEWDYDQNSFNAPVDEIDVRVVSEPVVARPRKLKSIYMFDVAYDLKMSFGLDMDQVILKATSGEIGYEIDNEIMQDLLKVAGSDSTWNKLPEYKGMDVKAHEATLMNAINDASNTILGNTKRYEATFIVCGKNAATYIESMNTNINQYGEIFKRTATNGVVGGPHLIGVLDGKYSVYKNPYYPDDAMLIGAKGEMFIEAGYVYAPYLPLFASQLLVDADFKAQRGFCTLYAKKVVNKYMYHRIDLIDNTQVDA